MYTARRREDRDNTYVIAGTFFIYYVLYFTLIDIGSTRSYIARTVSVKLDISANYNTSKVSMVSPLDQFVRVDKVYGCVPLEIQGVVFLANLIELPFEEFDLILEIDWLVEYRVTLGCNSMRVTLRTKKNCEIVMIREYRDYLANVISTLVVKKLV